MFNLVHSNATQLLLQQLLGIAGRPTEADLKTYAPPKSGFGVPVIERSVREKWSEKEQVDAFTAVFREYPFLPLALVLALTKPADK